MGILPALFLGAVQGVTEFWPISSSAHLALLIHLFGWGEPDLSFLVALHLGTWIAVVWHYRRRLWRIVLACLGELTGRGRGGEEARLGWMLLLATVPGVVLGAVFAESSEMMEGMPLLMAFTLAAFGLALWCADALGSEALTWREAGWRQALAVGVAQALAVMPGVSRSGASISAARAGGLERREAADFSFLLSVPIIGAAAAYEGFKLLRAEMPGGAAWPMLCGAAASAVTGYLAIRVLLTRLESGTFRPYAVYRLVLAAALVLVLVVL
ncbi:MAG: undecaprenyl-diphosphate phosphatase [Actinobacteria bacterium]|nr:undecaprenyl-diphosphate phosphatase [Actinomycetota bacterium]MDI6830462.1 undecaprenyl-diphosphate phosphatase [Actinomycetota bacterium]